MMPGLAPTRRLRQDKALPGIVSYIVFCTGSTRQEDMQLKGPYSKQV